MEEHEVKILEVNRKDLESKLMKLGAKKIYKGSLQTIFYDFKNRSLLKNKSLIRIRSDGQKNYLCSKKPILNDDIKIMDENETEVSNLDEIKKILESIGLIPFLVTRKRRKSFSINGTHFDFDKYLDQHDYIPEFLEIESTSKDEIMRYCKLLGFNKTDIKSWTTKDLIEYYKK